MRILRGTFQTSLAAGMLAMLLAPPEALTADFLCTTNSGGLTIYSCSNYGPDLVIPNQIYGLPVTGIEGGTFQDNATLTNVTLPESVTWIGYAAFSNCERLRSIKLPKNLTTIEDCTFVNCAFYPTIKIPDTITSIGAEAFYMCNGLFTVTLPGCLTNIGSRAFADCDQLSECYFAGNAPAIAEAAFQGSYITLYYLPGTVGWGPMLAGCPTVLWNPTIQIAGSNFGPHPDGFGLPITGTPGIPIVVEASSQMAGTPWVELYNGALNQGSILVRDPNWTSHAARFYRVRSP